MNNLQRNSATIYNKARKDNLIKKELIMRREKERYNENIKKVKLKKWQNPDYQESIRLKKEEELKKEIEKVNKVQLEKTKPIEQVHKVQQNQQQLQQLQQDVKQIKNQQSQENKKVNKENQNALVKFDVNQDKHLDPIKQRMVYIQYLLNTFEMYPEFDIHYYRNNNDDIKHLNNYELVYHWNHYGVNEKHKRIYNRETFMRAYPNFYKDYPIYIFMHVCNLHNGIQIFNDQLKSIIDSGLYDKCKNILVCIVGKSFDIPTDKYNKLILLYQDNNPKYYEVKTINYIKYIANKVSDNARILYVHTKGVRKNGDEVCVRSWRKLLEYYTIINHDIALQYLMKNYDTVGSNVINMSPSTNPETRYLYAVNPNHFFHYSGNFWWTTAEHVRRLPMLNHDPNKNAISTRCRAENWILSALPHMSGFEMYYNKNYVHPYSTYCDPNGYQKKYMEVFTGRNNFSSLLEV